jgi:YggT family protein
MFSFVNNFWYSVLFVLYEALNVYMWIVIIRALISWVNPDPYNPIVRFLVSITEPILRFIRRKIPAYFGGMDFSPVILLFVIYVLRVFLSRYLMGPAFRLG